MHQVLVIEDSNSFSQILKVGIEGKYGYHTDVASTLSDASDLLTKKSDQYFACVVDLNLPDAPNGEAVDLVQQFKIPAIVFTGQLSDALREDVLSKNVADYVLKHGQHNIEYVLSLVHRIWKNQFMKVLVVDDSLTARKQIARLLSIQHYQTILAESGLEALNLLNQHPDVKIAILDCHMDGMDGFELTNRIREKNSKDTLAIIGVSSQGGNDISAKFIKNGANDFIVKPFVHEEFFCRINQNADFLDHFQALRDANEKKNKVLGMAAHDIRSPLSVIKTSAELLAKGSLENERQKKLVNMINKTSNDMLALLNDLLDVSSIESGQLNINLKPIKLSSLVKDKLASLRDIAAQKQQQIHEDISEVGTIEADEYRILQVIDNLATNAIKYSPLESEIYVRLKKLNRLVRFEIEDEGPGIEEQYLDKLYGAFQTTSNMTTGGERSTGLGLAICKQLIENHNGSIGYEPGTHGGSCFYFELPTA